MTMGELARLFNEHFGIGCELEVIEMGGWSRDLWYDETDGAMGAAVAEHSDAGQLQSVSRARCIWKARKCPKGGELRGLSN